MHAHTHSPLADADSMEDFFAEDMEFEQQNDSSFVSGTFFMYCLVWNFDL